MPTRCYEYDCGHVRNISGVPYETINMNDPYFNSHFAFQQPEHGCYNTPYNISHRTSPERSAAAALEYLDRDTHAQFAGVPTVRRQSIQFHTQIRTPRTTDDRRGSGYIRTSRVGQILVSSKKAEKSEKHRCRQYFKDRPCKDCRRDDLLERERYAVETQRIIMGLRPPPGEYQRGTGGNRYRGDSWYEEFDREMIRSRAMKVRFEAGS